MSIVLTFSKDGDGYMAAKAVADAMNMSIEAYLMACIEEGHHVMRARYNPSNADLETPTFMQRGVELKFP